MKNIVILTATRAEYGLLKPLMIKIDKDPALKLSVAVTGTHLSPEFGMTVKEIENDGISINKKIEIVLSSDTPVSISKSMGLAVISFAEYFEELKPDALMVLGDRYETLAVCCAAMNARIPIIHLYGGEATEGVIDEAVRHAITKMSHLHFTAAEVYRHRVIQMGERPDRVYNVGAIGVENAVHVEAMSLLELKQSLGIDLGQRFVVGTFHPVTLEHATAGSQAEELLAAIDCHPDITWLFTKANADTDGRVINEMMVQRAQKHDNFYFVDSLGMKRYLSALRYALFVIGNSSSGLVEVPSFGIPTINIGDRQKGRIKGASVIQCKPERNDIGRAIDLAMDADFRRIAARAGNPYGDGETSDIIMHTVRGYLLNEKIDMKKKFYDIDFAV